MEHLPLDILGEIASHLKDPKDLSCFVSSFKKVNGLNKNKILMDEVERERRNYNRNKEIKLREYAERLEWENRYQPSKFDF